MTAKEHIKLAQRTTLISFLLGTGIFLLYYFTATSGLLFIGLGFIGLAGTVNIGIFIFMLVKAYKDKENRKSLLLTSGLMLLNIPIVKIYSWLTLILLGVIRITFTNSTSEMLTNIKIVGCGGGTIEKLEVGESKTVWVDITGDCSINVKYLANKQQKEETVVGYATSKSGGKINHHIGEQNKIPF